MSEERQKREAPVREAWDGGDHDRAATLAVELYGQEIFGFLMGRLRSRGDASEVFSMFLEDFWVGLPNFGWRCSLRSWAYKIARHAAHRYVTAPQQRSYRHLTLSQQSQVARMADRVRTATVAYRRTETKNRVRELREKLPPDDQTLLILRVDRQFSWRELTMIMVDGGDQLPEDVIERESARLRQRFQRVKGRLKELAEEAGLLD